MFKNISARKCYSNLSFYLCIVVLICQSAADDVQRIIKLDPLAAGWRDSARFYLKIEMNFPFSLDNTSLSLDASGSESSSNSDPKSVHGRESPDCSLFDGHGVASNEAVLSTEWMFSGSYVVDMASNPVEFSSQFLNGHFQQLALCAPVSLDHMIVFANAHIKETNRVYSVSIRGYIYGNKTSMSAWKAWLGQKLLWTPLSDIGLSDEYDEDLTRAEDPDKAWFVLGKYGRRSRFRILCKAFYFEVNLYVDVPESIGSDDGEASYILQLVKTEFMAAVDNGKDTFQSKGAEFVLVQCDTRPLADASTGSTVCVPIQGFLQAKKTDLQTWIDWLEARWSVAPGGLCGLEDFEKAISESSPWETIYTFGKLGKNNTGRKAAAQASGVQSRVLHCVLLLVFIRDQCCAAAVVAQRRAPAIRLFVHQLVRLIRSSRLVSCSHLVGGRPGRRHRRRGRRPGHRRRVASGGLGRSGSPGLRTPPPPLPAP